MPRRTLPILLSFALLWAGSVALAGPPLSAADAASLLSRYPAGSVPVDPTVMTAIAVLGERGSRDEISLLRNLVDHERDEVSGAAVHAIAEIRDRQRVAQREAFAASVTPPPVARPVPGLGPAASSCVAYSRLLLGTDRAEDLVRAEKADEDAVTLLAHGRPRKAVAVLATDASPDGRKLAARAWEDLGEPRYAVQTWATLAATGDAESIASLDSYGVDVERLLLGMLVEPEGQSEGSLVEVLVRLGDDRTVGVLSERAAAGTPSERAYAADALGRLLETPRDAPVTADARAHALTALRKAASDPAESVRTIAEEVLDRAR